MLPRHLLEYAINSASFLPWSSELRSWPFDHHAWICFALSISWSSCWPPCTLALLWNYKIPQTLDHATSWEKRTTWLTSLFPLSSVRCQWKQQGEVWSTVQKPLSQTGNAWAEGGVLISVQTMEKIFGGIQKWQKWISKSAQNVTL